jgi:collagenase-like PrtC family protease
MSIKFHLPDFCSHFELNLLLYEVMHMEPKFFYPDIEIGSVYGTFPTSLWNGGRTCGGGFYDKHYMKEVIRQFNTRGIACRYTFSNPHIKEEHLNDEFCNMCLQLANNGMNEVIVVSPVLEAYIRNKYPKYKIISSTCKQIEDIKGLTEELEKDYSLVVLDYNWNNCFERLSQVPHKERCEILINPCCIPNCPRRKEHYDSIGKHQIAMAEHFRKTPKVPFRYKGFDCDQITPYFYATTKYKTHVTPKDIYEKYVPMGYRNFKIEGRSYPDASVMESYVYYMVKPEYRDEARLYMNLANIEITKDD